MRKCSYLILQMRKMRTERLIICTGSHDSSSHLAKLDSKVYLISHCASGPLRQVHYDKRPFSLQRLCLVRGDVACLCMEALLKCVLKCMWHVEELSSQVQCMWVQTTFWGTDYGLQESREGGVIKKDFREQEGVQLTLEEGNHLDSSQVWKAFQVSGVPRTCQVT